MGAEEPVELAPLEFPEEEALELACEEAPELWLDDCEDPDGHFPQRPPQLGDVWQRMLGFCQVGCEPSGQIVGLSSGQPGVPD